MGKKKTKGNAGLAFFYVVVVIIGIVITLVSNLLNFSTIYNYGPNQYISNIWHGHHDYYCSSSSKIRVFDKIMPAKNIENHESIVTLNKNKNFKFKGYIAKDNITWIAIETYQKTERLNGYFVIPEKVSDRKFWADLPFKNDQIIRENFFLTYDFKQIEKSKSDLIELWKQSCLKEFPIKQETDSINIQKLRESNDYKIIEYISDDDVVYYCNTEIYSSIEDFYNMYLGENFDTYVLQIADNYNPQSDGVFKESVIERFISKWYFKLGFPIFSLFFLIVIFSALFAERSKCPKCESLDIVEGDGKAVAKTFQHTRKDGEKDLRYKENPIVTKYKRTDACNSCSHRWAVTYSDVHG